MPRPKPTDSRTRKLLSKLTRLQLQGGGKGTTDWEKTFLKEVKARVAQYGSAFADSEKGDLDHSLSIRQSFKMCEIDRLIRYRGKTKVAKKKSYR